jgi:hypothetical protein
MPSRTFAGSAALKGDWDAHEGGWKPDMDTNLLKLSVLTQGRVISQIAAEPGSPAQGDVYLLFATHPTHPNEIAVYDEATWHYFVPLAGWRLYNVALSSFMRFDGGSWGLDDIAAPTSGGDGVISDGTVSGLSVVYAGTGLNFAMTAGTFYLNGSLYSAAAQTLALDAADAVLPRIDTMYVGGDGTFGKITGTPDADPEAPEVDPETQLFLLSLTVPAAAVDLTAGIDEVVIYNEGTEWPATLVGAHINAASLVDPYSGTKSIEATAAVLGDRIRLIAAAPIAFGGAGNLLFRLKSKGPWAAGQLIFSWYLAGRRVGRLIGRVRLRDGSFGFDSSNTADDQLISIPKSRFYLSPTQEVDELRIQVVSGGGIGFFLDVITLQTPDDQTSIDYAGLTQDQADTLYLSIAGRATAAQIWEGSSLVNGVVPQSLWDAQEPQTLVDGATVTMDGDEGFNFEWDIAGNRNMANPINMKPGQSGTIRIKQDATGNRVVTWDTDWEFPGGAATGGALSAGANEVDYVSYVISNSGKARAVVSKDFRHA